MGADGAHGRRRFKLDVQGTQHRLELLPVDDASLARVERLKAESHLQVGRQGR